MMSLEQQISITEDRVMAGWKNDEAILASLKRLQAIEGQEVYGYVPEYYQSAKENGLGFVQCHGEELDGLMVKPVYALPPDAQGMIDKLTAERDDLKQWKEAHATKMGVGDGSGELYVYGDYDSIKAAQSIIFERDALKAQLADKVPESWTNLLAYVLQDDVHNRLTPRVIDIAYLAFMAAKQPNKEDGGASDWFTDTKPMIAEAISKLKKDLIKERGEEKLAQGEAVAPELMAIYDVYNFPNSWLMSMAAPIGTEYETVWSSLEKQKYKIDNVILRHTMTYDKSLVSQLLTDYGYTAPSAKPVSEECPSPECETCPERSQCHHEETIASNPAIEREAFEVWPDDATVKLRFIQKYSLGEIRFAKRNEKGYLVFVDSGVYVMDYKWEILEERAELNQPAKQDSATPVYVLFVHGKPVAVSSAPFELPSYGDQSALHQVQYPLPTAQQGASHAE